MAVYLSFDSANTAIEPYDEAAAGPAPTTTTVFDNAPLKTKNENEVLLTLTFSLQAAN